ncbi:MAG: COX15/CtaA family protein, partial [Pseudobdellovibrionaceae bacterium]
MQEKKIIFWSRLLWILWVYTLLVILWGAWVRISHSGDGCGDTWPLCHGKLIPEAERGKTWVEYGHRLMSGIYGLVVFYIFYQGRRFFAGQAFIRKSLSAILILTITEALLGAKLVLFGLVSSNDSLFRLFAMTLHQVNSLLLSGAVIVAALAVQAVVDLQKNTDDSLKIPIHPDTIGSDKNDKFSFLQRRSFFLVLFIIIAVTGAWASLSGTLFPSLSLLQGLQMDLAAQAHPILRLRMAHPLMALSLGGGMVLYFWLQAQKMTSNAAKKIYLQTALGIAVALVFGFLTLKFLGLINLIAT